MPDTLVAPAVPAAPSSPAPAASSSPAAQPSPAPPSSEPISPSSTPDSPSIDPAAAAPTTDAAPSQDGWKGKPRPKDADYNGDIAKFMTDDIAWEEANPDAGTSAATKEATEGEQVVDQQQDDADKTADTQADIEAPTPEKIAGWAKDDADFNAWLEKNPAKKGELFAMSRELERARPIADLFPTVEDATDSLAKANRMVSIKAALEGSIANPQTIGSAVETLMEEFVITDEKTGEPVLDADGHKQYAEDAQLMADYFADAKHEAKVGELKEAIAGGKLNEHQKNNYEAAVQAWEFLKAFDAQSDFERGLPAESEMDESTRNWVNQERERIKAEQDKLEGNRRAAQTAEQKTAAAAHEKAIKVEAAKGFGTDIKKMVDETINSGVYIPAFLLQEVDPVTGVNTFVKGIYDRFLMETVGWSESQKRYIPGKGVPRLKEKLARLEAMPRSEASQRARIEFQAQLRADFLPKIFNARLKEIQKYSRDERNRAAQKTGEARTKVAPEISGGSSSRPPGAMTEKLAHEQATREFEAKNQGKYVDPATRVAAIMEREEALLNGAR